MHYTDITKGKSFYLQTKMHKSDWTICLAFTEQKIEQVIFQSSFNHNTHPKYDCCILPVAVPLASVFGCDEQLSLSAGCSGSEKSGEELKLFSLHSLWGTALSTLAKALLATGALVTAGVSPLLKHLWICRENQLLKQHLQGKTDPNACTSSITLLHCTIIMIQMKNTSNNP